MPLIFAEAALDDLAEIRTYISAEDTQAAERVARRLRDACDLIERHPRMGRPAARPGTREFVVHPYVVGYRPEGDDVIILRIWHGARDRWSE